MKRLLWLAVLAATSCGSSDLMVNGDGPTGGGDMAGGGGGDMAMGGGGGDMAMGGGGGDMSIPPGISCGAQTCMGSDICCVTNNGGTLSSTCSTSCPDGGTAVECDGPEDCGGNPCCVMLTGGTMPMLSSVMCTSTPTACPPMFSLTGPNQTRRCHSDADCAVSGNPNNVCCTFSQGGQSAQGCFNPQLVPLTNGAVTCP
jgi:hypothetical protein